MVLLDRLSVRLRKTYYDNYFLLLLLVLFVSFRLLALLLFRPGGFIIDTSDYEYYRKLGELAVKGYEPNQNLITAYPPLFPTLAVALFEVASRVPPWFDPRLFYHVLLGGVLLIFETGNFLVIADIARRLAAADDDGVGAEEPSQDHPWAIGTGATRLWKTLGPPLIYMLLFAPVYTWLGWFECMPLFFMLLGLDLLLVPRDRVWGWLGSAVVTAFGFLTKLTPILLVPIAVRLLGLSFNWEAIRSEWFRRGNPHNARRAGLYLAAFFLTVAGLGYLFGHSNPSLFFQSLNSIDKRLPWETIWALLAGQYSYGSLPVDERNPAALAQSLPTGGLPWGPITAVFLLIYLWLYTRPYDWRRPRTTVSFTAASMLALFLSSRGWSPQFQVWVLAFVALLLPNLYGVLFAVVLMLVDYAEVSLYMNILRMAPGTQWVLAISVVARTGLLLGLTLLFLSQIWPAPRPADNLRAAGRALASATMAAFLLTGLLSAPQVAQDYWQEALFTDPCAPAIKYLQQRASGDTTAIATPDIQLWQDLYPWLRERYQFLVLDNYSPNGDPADAETARLVSLAQSHRGTFWWAEMSKDKSPQDQLPYFARSDVQKSGTLVLGDCRLTRVTQRQPLPETTVQR